MVKSERAPGTAPGDWLVDDRCINCGAARHVAPRLIIERGGLSIFHHQPVNAEEQHMAWLAAAICPTRSVKTESRQRPPVDVFPHLLSPGVYLCGHNARSSYGAHSYYVQRPDGNILIDSPVFTNKLVRPFETKRSYESSSRE